MRFLLFLIKLIKLSEVEFKIDHFINNSSSIIVPSMMFLSDNRNFNELTNCLILSRIISETKDNKIDIFTKGGLCNQFFFNIILNVLFSNIRKVKL